MQNDITHFVKRSKKYLTEEEAEGGRESVQGGKNCFSFPYNEDWFQPRLLLFWLLITFGNRRSIRLLLFQYLTFKVQPRSSFCDINGC